jgi:hypothetical protein
MFFTEMALSQKPRRHEEVSVPKITIKEALCLLDISADASNDELRAIISGIRRWASKKGALDQVIDLELNFESANLLDMIIQTKE